MPDVRVINIPLGWSLLPKLLDALSVIVSELPAWAEPVSVVTDDAVIVMFPLAWLGVIVNVGE